MKPEGTHASLTARIRVREERSRRKRERPLVLSRRGERRAASRKGERAESRGSETKLPSGRRMGG